MVKIKTMSKQTAEMQAEKSKALEDKSVFFHDIIKGCQMKPAKKYLKMIFSNGRKVPLKMSGQECMTHKGVWCCNCGWEYGYHYKLSH